jgi:hypothetical protein
MTIVMLIRTADLPRFEDAAYLVGPVMPSKRLARSSSGPLRGRIERRTEPVEVTLPNASRQLQQRLDTAPGGAYDEQRAAERPIRWAS